MNSRFALTAAGVAILAVTVWVASFLIAHAPGMAFDDLGKRANPPPASDRSNVSYTLPEGATAGQVGEDLQRLGIIRSSYQFKLLIILMGFQDSLSADEHILRKNSAVPDVIRQLTVTGVSLPVVRVTFPEGIRIEEMAERAEAAGIGTKAEFLAAAAAAAAVLPAQFAADKTPGSEMQGYLFPDTYIFPIGATSTILVQEMIATLDRRFTPELRTAVRAQGLNLHPALTLASIVEREAVIETDRPLIASVFFNRLAEGMKLDADPTTQFAAALDPLSVLENGYWKKELTRADLENPSPYNTYRNAGLPPGPIANPSLASIQAVANPASTRYYYFVADAKKGDGSHVFAETLAQHNANVARVGSP